MGASDRLDPARREFLNATAVGLLAGRAARSFEPAGPKLGIPGPQPGRVIAVHHPGSIASGAYRPEAIQQVMRKGMMELTGAPGWVEAWRVFARPGDVVGIKVNPVGGKKICSDAGVLHQIIDGLKQAGVRLGDIFVYDRYRMQLVAAGIDRWLPEGVRWSAATEQYDTIQLGMAGFDPDRYVELPIIQPGQDYRDAHFRRSYVAKFLTQQVNKVINLPCLKHHHAAGVTLALKNIAYGMANNVNRSHQGKTINLCGAFIPAIVDLPVFRQKVVLHILDGVKGGYEEGPSIPQRYIWEHNTMYFATDPVALDKICWRVIDEKRVQQGLPPVALSGPGDGSQSFLHLAPEHIEIAGVLGLGVFDDAKIELRRFALS